MNKRVCVCNVYGVPYVGMYSVYLYTKLTVCIWSFNVYKKYKKIYCQHQRTQQQPCLSATNAAAAAARFNYLA